MWLRQKLAWPPLGTQARGFVDQAVGGAVDAYLPGLVAEAPGFVIGHPVLDDVRSAVVFDSPGVGLTLEARGSSSTQEAFGVGQSSRKQG